MKIRYLVAGLLGLSLISGGSYCGYQYYQHPEIDLVSNTISIEYGTNMSMANSLIQNNIKTPEASVKNIFENKTDEYAPIGEYTVPVTYRDTEVTFNVSVEDTTAPELLVDSDELSKSYDNGYVTENTFLQYSRASDLNEYSISVKFPDGFDNTKPGDYTCTIEAKDSYGNTSDEDVSFSIKEPAKDTGNTLAIDSIGVSDARIGIGDDQDAVNQYDILLLSQFSTPGSGEPILMAGHNTRSFADLSKVKVDDIIRINWDGTEYQYKVSFSGIVSTTGSDLTNKETGENMIEYSGREVLQMYTCYKIYADNERWMLKADPVTN